jgi:hypothetical protein
MSEIPTTNTLLTADDSSIGTAFGPQQWGIFGSSGQPILVADSVAAVEYTREYDISDYPVEQGGFASYNKVQTPFQARVSLLSNRTRQQLLNTLEAAVASLQLVSIVTPEITYPNANLIRYHLQREVEHGVTLIRVDVWAEEVRILSNPTTNQGANTTTPADGGTNRPVGTLNPGSNVSPGSSATGNLTAGGETAGGATGQPIVASAPIPPAAITSQSNNAAYPTQSGPIQPQIPTASQSSLGLTGIIPNSIIP